jgi:hypothetical protein
MKTMQKEFRNFFFALLNASTFGEAKGTIKRAKYKINSDIYFYDL